ADQVLLGDSYLDDLAGQLLAKGNQPAGAARVARHDQQIAVALGKSEQGVGEYLLVRFTELIRLHSVPAGILRLDPIRPVPSPVRRRSARDDASRRHPR